MTVGINPRETYTLAEAAWLIGRAPTTLRNQYYRGVLKAEKRGRDIVVLGRDLERYAADHRRVRP